MEYRELLDDCFEIDGKITGLKHRESLESFQDGEPGDDVEELKALLRQIENTTNETP